MSTFAANRLPDLETILLWEGEIDNLRIRELFGVQPVWASRLLGELTKHMGRRAARACARARSRAMAHACLVRTEKRFQRFQSWPGCYCKSDKHSVPARSSR